MKVKELLPLLCENQETSIYFKDYGHMSTYPGGFQYETKALDANIEKIETNYIDVCGCTEIKIYTDYLPRRM